MVASWHDYPAGLLGYTEGPLLRWLSETVRAGETWLDVGAHYGYTALALARLVGPSGRVFAFEPVPATGRCLSQTRLLNKMEQLRVISVGLADSAHVTAVEVRLVRGMAEPEAATGEAAGTVPMVSLDRIWHRLAHGDDRIHGVKMDVQGMELRALGGMQAILMAQHPQVALEFHTGVDRPALLSLLADCGYQLPGRPLAPLRDEGVPRYLADRTYLFSHTA
jgi:FkbM family methyltransferase